MLQFDFSTFDLPFEYPFKISKGLKTSQPTLIVFLAMGAQYGLGEATEILYYDNTISQMADTLQKQQNNIRKYAYNGPERFWHYMHHLIPDQHFLISALDCASWDLWSKLQGQPLHSLLKLKWSDQVPATDYTLGISSPEALLDKIKAHPFPVYKLKVNGAGDIPMLQTLLERTVAKVRIDANEGWDKDDFNAILPLLSQDRVELIEQPFHKEDLDSLHYYKEKCGIPVIADEAITGPLSLKQQLGYYDGVNIKLSKCGGITPALQMIQYARQQNKKVMLGSMSESAVGAAALAQLLPLADYADIDGPLLLKKNVGTGLMYAPDGKISFREPVGIGISWKA
ncbi:MAG: dipeptide epimerase [Taibaiella sp.]|nr:dipeptide epimerase [Taibaiella sp.]